MRLAVSLALVVVAPGLAPYEAAAAALGRSAPRVSVPTAPTPVPQLPALSLGAPKLSAPTLGAPSVLSAPLAPAAAPIAAPVAVPGAQAVSPLSAPSALPLAPAAQAVAQPTANQTLIEAAARLSGGEGAQRPTLEKLYTGVKLSETGAGAVAGGAGSLSAPLPKRSVAELQDLAVDASKPMPERQEAVTALSKTQTAESRAALKAVGTSNLDGGAAEYELKRQALRALAEQGEVVSLPPVSEAHQAELAKTLSEKKPRAAVLDYDGTLEDSKVPASPETGAALKAVAEAGVVPIILSNRPDIADSVKSLGTDVKAPLVLAESRGARISVADKKGAFVEVSRLDGWTDAQQAAVKAAGEVTTAQFGAGTLAGKTFSISPFGFITYLPANISAEKAQEAASALKAALQARGIEAAVHAEMAENAGQVPQLIASKVDKSDGIVHVRKTLSYAERARDAVRYKLPLGIFRKLLGPRKSELVDGKELVIVGDRFFGDRAVDSPMAKGAPGALSISVQGKADPRLDNVFVWRTEGPAGTKQVLSALSKPAQNGDPAQKKAVIGMFTQRTVSIVAFLMTAIAYPFLAIPVVGVAGFGALMALGPLAGIATGPINGLIAKKLSARNAMMVNTVVRIVLNLMLPAFALGGILNFWTLLAASIANGWLLSSIMTTEGIYVRRFSGKHFMAVNALANVNYLSLQMLLGLVVGIGSVVDKWNPMVPYYVSAAAHVLVAAIIWFTIPNTFGDGSTSGAVKVKELGSKAVSALKGFVEKLKLLAHPSKLAATKAGAWIKKYWKEAALFGVGLALFPFIHSTIPATLALVWWISRTAPFKELWANPKLRSAVLFIGLCGILFFPLQSFSLPLIAEAIAGKLGKAQLLGQLLGALFFGQLISSSSQAALPSVRIPFIGQVQGKRLVQAVVLALGAVWVGLRLFPGSWPAIAAAVAIGAILMAVSERMNPYRWVRTVGIGLSFLLLPLLAWGNIPLLFASLLGLGLFYGPAWVALTGYFAGQVPKSGGESQFAIQGTFLNAAISLGYGIMSLAAGFFKPAFPTLLTPLGIAFIAAGLAFFFLAPRLLQGLQGSPDSKAKAKGKETQGRQ